MNEENVCELCGGTGELEIKAHQSGGEIIDSQFFPCSECNPICELCQKIKCTCDSDYENYKDNQI